MNGVVPRTAGCMPVRQAMEGAGDFRMRAKGWGLSLTSLLLLTSGCITPYNTQFPSFGFKHPLVEKRSYEIHDPYPDASLGPDTQSRPRGFDIERREPRRKREQNFLLQSQPEPGIPTPTPPAGGPTGWKYPHVVPN